MDIIEKFRLKASKEIKRIVLPEGEDSRIIKAASIVQFQGIAKPILIGDIQKIKNISKELKIDIRNIEICDINNANKIKNYAKCIYEIRKEKGMSHKEADLTIKKPMYYGVMMVKMGEADGLVAGATHATKDMLVPVLQIIKAKPNTKLVSSTFFIECKDKDIGENGALIFADCIINPCPNADELANIAVDSAKTAKTLFGIKSPRVAFLSFSSKGCAKHELVNKVFEAVKITRRINPELAVDGELQFDTAVIPEIGMLKAPESEVAGRANVLIFPDLQSGNIAYKVAQRIGNVKSFAVLQGLLKPCNDLSRGCTVDDIVNTIAATAVQAQNG